MNKLAIIAIGGNSLIRNGEKGTTDEQIKNAEKTFSHISEILKLGFRVVITHGNGPQVGNQLLRTEAGEKVFNIPLEPLDVCVSDTQGTIGYILQQTFENVLKKKKLHYNIISIITQCIVDENDSAFWFPSKPIGPFYTKEDAEKKISELKWIMKEDSGRGFRRVVASPKPIDIVEVEAIKSLLENNFIVIACGGGGIPVIQKNKNLVGVEAVIDKDRASSFLAKKLNADYFIISTDADKVYLNYKKANQIALDKLTVVEAKQFLSDWQFPAGSMGPKIEAAIDFVSSKEKICIITSPENIFNSLKGKEGTKIVFS